MKDTMPILTKEDQEHIDVWVRKFPEGKERSAMLMALRIVQKRWGWLDEEKMNAVADYLGLPRVYAYEVASFYSMYHRKPVGKYCLKVCNSISCALKGSKHVLKYLEHSLNIGIGETTQDGTFTLQETECLAACTEAPVLVVNDDEYHIDLNRESVDRLLGELRMRNESD